MKKIIVLLCLTLCLTGCQGGSGEAAEQNAQESRTAGVYYPEIDEKEVGLNYSSGKYSDAAYLYSLLYYDGRMYTSVEVFSSTDKSGLALDSILEDELGTVSGNHDHYWSSEGERLLEITGEGTLYRIKGYDENFCVGIYYERVLPSEETCCFLMVFEQLNGITLEKGRELFGERFHFDEAVRITGRAPGKEKSAELLSEDGMAEEFLAALNEGIFIDPAGSEYPKLDTSEAYTLSFYDTAGMVRDIKVYESGYVTMEDKGEEPFVLRVEEEQCKAIIGRIGRAD